MAPAGSNNSQAGRVAVAGIGEGEGEEEQGGDDSMEDAPELTGFRLGLPQSSLRRPLLVADSGSPAAGLRSRLDRKSMVLFERFHIFRTVYIVVATDGDERFVRYRAHRQWVEILERHGFAPSPVVPGVVSDVVKVSVAYPSGSGVRSVHGGVELVMCGRDRLQQTYWCCHEPVTPPA